MNKSKKTEHAKRVATNLAGIITCVVLIAVLKDIGPQAVSMEAYAAVFISMAVATVAGFCLLSDILRVFLERRVGQ